MFKSTEFGLLFGAFVAGGLPCQPARAETLSVVHSFDGKDGAQPMSGLVADRAGNLYGETTTGGAKCVVLNMKQPQGCGTVFKITSHGVYRVLITFRGRSNGSNANLKIYGYNGVTLHGKLLYGTASLGGANDNGVLFSVKTDGSDFTILHSFSGIDGEPIRTPIVDHDGTVYGATNTGGPGAHGLLYKVSPDGIYQVLYSGIQDPTEFVLNSGNIFGSANVGCGVVYKLNLSTLSYKVLYSFDVNENGACIPHLGFLDGSGNIIGATESGDSNKVPAHFGTLFELQKSGSSYVYSTLWTFRGGQDGGFPSSAPSLTSDGAIVGSTRQDGTNHQGGTIYSFAHGALTTLHQFTRPEGLTPYSSLTELDGILFGTTFSGAIDCYATNQGCGSVYGYAPAP